MTPPERQPDHARNAELEQLLTELNAAIAGGATPAPTNLEPQEPVLFIVGAPRSGTTLLLQWLSATGHFGVPTNLISRFYAAPHVGALVQRLLTDPQFDFNGELSGLPAEFDFSSRLGKTRGPLAPNEFWYFWRRFLPNDSPRVLSPEEEAQVDRRGLASGLAQLASALGQPLALKALILQYNLAVLAQAVPRALFLHIRREPLYTVQSILQGRDDYFGDRNAWWSVEPPGTEELRERDPFDQVAGQVAYTHRSLDEQLAQLPESQSLTLAYEAFCADPASVWPRLLDRLHALGATLDAPYRGPERFDTTNTIRVPPGEWERIERAYAAFA